jgi:ABC-type transport system involved in multi-copper enzyme maturation permease subunit
MKALVRKELRELLGITAAALGCYLVLVVSLMGAMIFNWIPGMPSGTREVPFTDISFEGFFLLISIAFAAALGLRQSAVEAARGTFLFLLHRPVRRDAIFLTKLATGAGVLVLCAGVPIVAYGAWASVPGHHPGPFEWSMTVPAWQTVVLLPLVYLGAFLSGLRPARWFGTRLLPLVGSLGALWLVSLLPWWLSLALAVLLYGLLAANVCWVARARDYA